MNVKYCRNCNAPTDDAVLRCPYCSGTEFYLPDGTPLPSYNQPNAQQQGQPGQYGSAPRQDQAGQYDHAPQNGQPGQYDYASQNGQPGQYGYAPQNGQPGQYGYAPQNGQPGQYGYAPQNGQPGQYGYAPQNGQPGQYGYAPQNGYAQPGTQPKKRSHTGLIIGIVIGVLVLILGVSAIAAVLIGRFVTNQAVSGIEDQLDDFDVDDFFSENDGDDVLTQADPYVPGVFEDNVYVNEWADLRFELPDGWSEASQEAYDSYNSDSTTCDFYAVSDKRELLAVIVVDVSDEWGSSLYSEETLLEEILDGMRESFPQDAESSYDSAMIGGNLFQRGSLSGNMNGADVCISQYVRQVGDNFVVVSVTSSGAAQNAEIVSTLDAAN